MSNSKKLLNKNIPRPQANSDDNFQRAAEHRSVPFRSNTQRKAQSSPSKQRRSQARPQKQPFGHVTPVGHFSAYESRPREPTRTTDRDVARSASHTIPSTRSADLVNRNLACVQNRIMFPKYHSPYEVGLKRNRSFLSNNAKLFDKSKDKLSPTQSDRRSQTFTHSLTSKRQTTNNNENTPHHPETHEPKLPSKDYKASSNPGTPVRKSSREAQPSPSSRIRLDIYIPRNGTSHDDSKQLPSVQIPQFPINGPSTLQYPQTRFSMHDCDQKSPTRIISDRRLQQLQTQINRISPFEEQHFQRSSLRDLHKSQCDQKSPTKIITSDRRLQQIQTRINRITPFEEQHFQRSSHRYLQKSQCRSSSNKDIQEPQARTSCHKRIQELHGQPSGNKYLQNTHEDPKRNTTNSLSNQKSFTSPTVANIKSKTAQDLHHGKKLNVPMLNNAKSSITSIKANNRPFKSARQIPSSVKDIQVTNQYKKHNTTSNLFNQISFPSPSAENIKCQTTQNVYHTKHSDALMLNNTKSSTPSILANLSTHRPLETSHKSTKKAPSSFPRIVGQKVDQRPVTCPLARIDRTQTSYICPEYFIPTKPTLQKETYIESRDVRGTTHFIRPPCTIPTTKPYVPSESASKQKQQIPNYRNKYTSTYGRNRQQQYVSDQYRTIKNNTTTNIPQKSFQETTHQPSRNCYQSPTHHWRGTGSEFNRDQPIGICGCPPYRSPFAYDLTTRSCEDEFVNNPLTIKKHNNYQRPRDRFTDYPNEGREIYKKKRARPEWVVKKEIDMVKEPLPMFEGLEDTNLKASLAECFGATANFQADCNIKTSEDTDIVETRHKVTQKNEFPYRYSSAGPTGSNKTKKEKTVTECLNNVRDKCASPSEFDYLKNECHKMYLMQAKDDSYLTTYNEQMSKAICPMEKDTTTRQEHAKHLKPTTLRPISLPRAVESDFAGYVTDVLHPGWREAGHPRRNLHFVLKHPAYVRLRPSWDNNWTFTKSMRVRQKRAYSIC